MTKKLTDTEKQRRSFLRNTFKQARIIVSEDAMHSAMQDTSGNYVHLSRGKHHFSAFLRPAQAQGIPKVNNHNNDEVQAMAANRLAQFVSEQSAMFIFNTNAENFDKVDLAGVTLSKPTLIGEQGSANVYTVKPVFD